MAGFYRHEVIAICTMACAACGSELEIQEAATPPEFRAVMRCPVCRTRHAVRAMRLPAERLSAEADTQAVPLDKVQSER